MLSIKHQIVLFINTLKWVFKFLFVFPLWVSLPVGSGPQKVDNVLVTALVLFGLITYHEVIHVLVYSLLHKKTYIVYILSRL